MGNGVHRNLMIPRALYRTRQMTKCGGAVFLGNTFLMDHVLYINLGIGLNMGKGIRRNHLFFIRLGKAFNAGDGYRKQ